MVDLVLLAGCIGATFVLVLYLFYWNRLLAYVIGLVFRLLYWGQSDSSVWVEIGSIHFSLLAGRILFKDVRYHSSNQTLRIVKGQLTWAYWIRNPATQRDVSEARIHGRDESSTCARRCRIQLSFQGFEWFLYNRTASYDDIISQVAPDVKIFDQAENASTPATPHSVDNPFNHVPGWPRTTYSVRKALSWIRLRLPNLDPKSLFPFGIQINQGAIVCGNLSTPSLLLLEYQSAEGTFGAVQPRSKYDLYKQVLNLSFHQVLGRLIDNDDYRGTLADNGESIFRRVTPHLSSSYLSFSAFTKLWNRLRLYPLVYSQAGKNRRQNTSHGKSTRSGVPGKEGSIHSDTVPLEYAIERKFLETALLDMSYFADVVGDVPLTPDQAKSVGLEDFDIGNGDIAPEWGFDIIVWGGFLRYGPWADRQRMELQKVFFPFAYRDLEPTRFLKPGDKRLWTCMKIFIELRDETNLRIPFREASKNWQWEDGVDNTPSPKREPASVQITAGDSSSITYILPLVTGPMGYEPLIEVHLDTMSISSSLNDICVVSAESCRFSGILRTPLKWNAEREWTFSISLRQPILYLLRDHINMFTDLARDWISGPPIDSDRFIPMLYAIQLNMHQYETFLYANDHNIIDKPLLNDENALFILRGSSFRYQIQIPATNFRPETNTLPFHLEAPDVSLNLSPPRWSTHALHVPSEGSNLCKAVVFRLDGSFHFAPEVRQDFVEQLKLQISSRDVTCNVIGWAARYILVLRENYFGTFTNFSTLSEYLDKRKKGIPVGDPLTERHRPGMMNVLQVEIEFSVVDGLLVLPVGLPGYEAVRSGQDSLGTTFIFSIPEVQVYFRLHDYFMEMSLNVDTISGYLESESSTSPKSAIRQSRPIIYVDGVDITANRLFGPQPRTLTYLCFWTVSIGHVRTFLSTISGRLLVTAYNALQLDFLDPLNAPAAEYIPRVEPDITFLKVSLASLDVVCRAGIAALEFSCPQGLIIGANDLFSGRHQKLTSLRLPQASMRVFLREDRDNRTWLEAAFMSGDAFIDIYSSPPEGGRKKRTQAEFVQSQDILTNRTQWISRNWVFGQSIKPGRHRVFSGVECDPSRHLNGLYLPQRKPSLRASCDDAVIPLSSGVLPGTKTPRSQLVSIFSQSSQSSDCEGVSENNRDSQLASTRLTNPPTTSSLNEDNASITSGDESDTEDLTDICTSDDEVPDLHHGTPPRDYSALFMLYSPSTRHHRATWLEQLWQWDTSPFRPIKQSAELWDYCDYNTLRRSCRSLDHTGEGSSRVVRTRPAISASETQPSTSELSSVVFRAEFRKALALNITPLMVPAVNIFADDIRSSPFSPELFLDAIINAHLRGLVDARLSMQHTVLEIFLSHVHIRMIHKSPLVAGDHPLGVRSTPQHLRRDMAVHNEMVLSSFHFVWTRSHQVLRPLVKASVSFDCLSLRVAIDSNLQAYQWSRTMGSNVFKLDICGFGSELYEGRVQITCDAVTVELDHLAPQVLLDNFDKLVREQGILSDVYHGLRVNNAGAREDVIYRVLLASRGKTVVDPLTTIHPSYLVQGGRPYHLRADTTFRFLFHLRNCLRDMDDSELSVLSLSKKSIAPSSELNVTLLLESRLSNLVLDVDQSRPTGQVFGVLFPGIKNSNDRLPLSFLKVVRFASLLSKKIELTIRDPSSKSSSQIFLGDFMIFGTFRTLGLGSPSISQSTTLSQVSLSNRELKNIGTLLISFLAVDINIIVFPHLMTFGQQILRVHRQNRRQTTITAIKRNTFPYYIHFTSSICTSRIRAAAENLTFECQARALQISSTTLNSLNFSLISDEVFFRARSSDKFTKHPDQDILASLNFSFVKVVTLRASDAVGNNTMTRASISTGNTRLDVPRSALRLYRFIEEWRADYFPGIEATMQALLSEIQQVPGGDSSMRYDSRRPPIFELHGSMASFGVHLQVMHGTWLSWTISRSVAYLRSSGNALNHRHHRHFGLQLASQFFSISSGPTSFKETTRNAGVNFKLPTLSLLGQYDGVRIDTLVLVDFFQMKVKPSHWDMLLVVQQKFGQDFNDLMTLVAETRRQQRLPFASRSTTRRNQWKLVGSMKMRGFRVGLEGTSSIVYLECRDVRGGIDQDTVGTWNVQLLDLGLSLASRTVVNLADGFSNRNRLAFVVINFAVSAENRPRSVSQSDNLSISLTKINAVLQPRSIRDAGDFFNEMQSEILERKEQRVLELAAFKEKAKSIMKTFELNVRDTAGEPTSRPWISRYILNLSIRNVGAAFPLTLDQSLAVPQLSTHRGSVSVRAFLLSIKSLDFNTVRDEGGQAVIRGLALQFISRFRQAVPADFAGENHQTWNRLIYPEIVARLRSHLLGALRQVRIGASVSGFVLDLDSMIPEHISSLIKVYREGELQVARWTAISRTATSDNASQIEMGSSRRHKISITSNLCASLTFFSGKVRMYSDSASTQSKLRTSTYHHSGLSDDQVLDAGAEIFKLPVVSVWAEYRTSRTLHSDLVFKSTVHSSQNLLRPVLLHFMNELVRSMNVHFREMDSRHPKTTSLGSQPKYYDDTVGNRMDSMRISLSLRIDQSRLELTCQPDVNVIARLHWDSGGFIVNISPGAQMVTFTGCVGGLTIGLKHGFLSEDCVRLDARNLAFSMAFMGTELRPGGQMPSVSVIIDTQFAGEIRFSRLQDVLCFKAVWLDRFPLFATLNRSSGDSETKAISALSAPPTYSVNAFLFRIRQITLNIELGQSIGILRVDLQNALSQAKWTTGSSQFSLHIAEFSGIAKGNLSGQFHLPDFMFRTIRHRETDDWSIAEHPRMLQLLMTSGSLDIVLDSDHQRLLLYHAMPLHVAVFDDWSIVSPRFPPGNQRLRLSFTVTGTEIVGAVTVPAIPKLLTHARKFKANLEAQREGASRESQTFRVTQSPKPDHPLSAVAHALLYSARNRLKEAEAGWICLIRQHLSLRLSQLRLVIFPRTMLDSEMAQFLGKDINARLDRFVELDPRQPQTDLCLSISSMIVSKFSQIGHSEVSSSSSLDCSAWLAQLLGGATEAIIVGLPSMNINMLAQQDFVHFTRTLVYDFRSQFIRQEGTRDQDIYITLNMSLYSWLTVLRKNLSREMDQAHSGGQLVVASPHPTRPSVREQPLNPLGQTDSSQSLSAIKVIEVTPGTRTRVDQSSAPDYIRKKSHIRADSTRLSEIPVGFGESSHTSHDFAIQYRPRNRHIERLTMRQLGEATPDVMHPFFMKKAGFSFEDVFPQYVHEYATLPLEQIMEMLLKIYSKQLPLGPASK